MTTTSVEKQTFALSFSNKFQHIFTTQTLSRAKRLLRGHTWLSEQLSAAEYYAAHCTRSFLHEYWHECGPRPLSNNLDIKKNFFIGLLEETKVDCQSVVAVFNRDIRFKNEIAEFILLERLLRYPNQLAATANFDAGSGLFLFAWLKTHGYLTSTEWELDIEPARCAIGMAKLAQQIEALEVEDNTEYRARTRKFVRTLLPPGGPGERFSIPENYPWLEKEEHTPVFPVDFAQLY